MDDLRSEVTVKDLKNFFNFKQLTGNKDSLKRPITLQDINRPGLELAGFYKHTEQKRVVILGRKEISYIKTLSEAEQLERFNVIMDDLTPVIIISSSHRIPTNLKKLAMEKNFPVMSSTLPTFRLTVDIISYLDEVLAPCDNIHGVLMSVYGKGVLITGHSGMGKSETALELIRHGHVLVADDRVDVSRVHNEIMGTAPELLRGFLEIRGIGIIDIVQMFGASSILEKNKIDFVVNLEKFDQNADYARVGIEDQQYMNILDVDIPQIIFPVKEGRNMAVLIESAVTDFTLKQMGINSSKEFEQRVYKFIQNKNKGGKQ